MATVELVDAADGKTLKKLGKFKTPEEANAAITEWKSSAENAEKRWYYERHIFDVKNSKIIIDFGDHDRFIVIKTSKKDYYAFVSYTPPPCHDLTI